MEEKKIQYLKSKIGFHFTDLTATRQLELKARQEPIEFVYCALSKKTASNWNSYGFGLWSKEDFKESINNELKALEELSDEDFEALGAIKHSDLFEPASGVVTMYYVPVKKEDKKPKTRKELLSNRIDNMFDRMENKLLN